MLTALQKQFFKPIDNSPIILFRMLFGLLMAVESFGAIGTGWVKNVFMSSKLTFNFIWFDWLSLQPLPGDGMYYYFVVMGLVSIMVILGLYYRVSSVLLAILWSGVYFMQKTSYNNHYYLMVLLCWYMAIVPAADNYSLDAKRTGIYSATCANWYRVFFIIQVLIVFSFASFNKLTASWASGSFISHIFEAKTSYAIIGPLLGQAWFQDFITWSGLIFDALIIPMLIWKRTRWIALVGLVIFNLFNSYVLRIGIFPYLVIALTVHFYEPDYIRKVFFKKRSTEPNLQANFHKPIVFYLFTAYFLWQLYLPIRHNFIPGSVTWREEGHRLSWRMMLRSKRGKGEMYVYDLSNGRRYQINTRDYLNYKQRRRMFGYPDMIWQFAQFLDKEYQEKGIKDPAVFCRECRAIINSDYSYRIIDEDVDLSKVEWNKWGRNEWVLDPPKGLVF